jgi:hypothetical protein
MSWQPDRLLRALLGWTLFTATLPTIVTYRAGVQPLYEWGLYGITGRGIGPGYPLIVASAMLAWTVVVLGSRGARRPFGALLIVWHGLIVATLLYGVARFGDDMVVRGDAMHLRVNLAIVGPLLGLAVLAASIFWVVKHRGQHGTADQVPWRRNTPMLAAIAAALGVTIVALFLKHSGHPHYATDRAAIILIIAQVLVIGRMLTPPRTASGSRN